MGGGAGAGAGTLGSLISSIFGFSAADSFFVAITEYNKINKYLLYGRKWVYCWPVGLEVGFLVPRPYKVVHAETSIYFKYKKDILIINTGGGGLISASCTSRCRSPPAEWAC